MVEMCKTPYLFTTETQEKLEFFFNSLNKEKEAFGLSFEDVLVSKLLVLKEEKGSILGIAGVQKSNLLFLVVKEEYQNRGIGRELTSEVVRQARARNYSYIALNVYESNTKAIRIYTKLGFKSVYESLVNGKSNIFMMLPMDWRGKIAKNVFLIKHFLHYLMSLKPKNITSSRG